MPPNGGSTQGLTLTEWQEPAGHRAAIGWLHNAHWMQILDFGKAFTGQPDAGTFPTGWALAFLTRMIITIVPAGTAVTGWWANTKLLSRNRSAPTPCSQTGIGTVNLNHCATLWVKIRNLHGAVHR